MRIVTMLFYSLVAAGSALAQQSFVVVSAASGSPAVAPECIASAYGSGLASRTEAAVGTPLPTSLGGISLQVKDSGGTARIASLIYVSPGQINFVVPAGTASGSATANIVNGTGNVPSATVQVASVAPALFTADGSGRGVPAAIGLRRVIPTNIETAFPVFQCSASGCVPIPIELGIDTPIYLELFGTGIRNRSSLDNVKVTIGGISVPVLYAGPQPDFPGLDQVNIPITLNLRGMGVADLVLTVDGQSANTVRINVR